MPTPNKVKVPSRTSGVYLKGRWYSHKQILELKRKRINLHPKLYDIEKPGARSTPNKKGNRKGK